VAAGSTARRREWERAFRRSPAGRAITKRLPDKAKRGLKASRRWQRRAVAYLRSQWHRSLQFRVVGTTLLLSALVIAVLGFFLVKDVENNLVQSAETSARQQMYAARTSAETGGVNLLVAPPDMPTAEKNMYDVANNLQEASGDTPGSVVFLALYDATGHLGFPVAVPMTGERSVDWTSTFPAQLIAKVDNEQRRMYGSEAGEQVQVTQTVLTYTNGQAPVSALAAGLPVGRYYQIYIAFPFTSQQQTLVFVQQVLLGVGLALVALLAAIASLVTRWVVQPVRHAAQAALRLSAGHLEERLPVQGKDDLASLATSFNEMADSLQEKLGQLQELSSVQRTFVSDVSHELRTPLTTIRMAADLLFESRDELDPPTARSVELLQNQLERFESLLVDLLEISRFDAGAATLDAELVDVCDLVRRSADDAQQLSERRGGRIEFRLPAEGCLAEVDRRRVERILRNILVNAVEHGEGKDVVVTAAMDSDAVAVAVRDYGVGLAPGEEQLVFDRFWRADPARARTTGGTGLGLAISQEDARLHGGWLQAWGELGKGSVFRLTLPRVAREDLAGSPLPLEPDDVEVGLHG
jgi:two-component system, OmpR family, sensor histidine kinase MtrB